MLGFGIGLMRDLSDRVVRTSDQVERLLGTDCLATLPVLAAPVVRPGDAPPSPQEMRAEAGAFWAVVSSPFSRYAEGLRSIKSAIDLNSRIRTGRIVGLSSALPGEGKSTTAAGLALLSAQSGHKVILIDADLRNPALTKLMAPNAAAGLIDIVTGQRRFEDVVLREGTTGLDFVPTVIHAPIAHTSEILASEGMKSLVERLSSTYDYVIVDLSPLAPVIDVRSTGHFIPTYVLVVEWGKTNIDVLERALANARPVREHLLGVIMNKADTNLLKRYEGYGTSYYYDPKYSQPG